MRGLHEKLMQLGIPHEWSTGPGGHTWKYWSSVLPSMLRFELGNEPSRVQSEEFTPNHPQE